MQAASRSSIQAMKLRLLPRRVGPNMAIGNSTAVMATRNSEMPSTPRLQLIPNAPIHEWDETNWNPAACPDDGKSMTR